MKYVSINQEICRMRDDLKTAFRFMHFIENPGKVTDREFVQKILDIWYPRVPEDKDRAFQVILETYMGGDTYYKPLFDVKSYHSHILPRLRQVFGEEVEHQEWAAIRKWYTNHILKPYSRLNTEKRKRRHGKRSI